MLIHSRSTTEVSTMNKHIAVGICALLMLLVFSSVAIAQPANATIVNRGSSERISSSGSPTTQPSESGNTTAISMIVTSASTRWQGFYGNITGNISLGDSSGNALYNWAEVDVDGEVYAANYSYVDWSRIYCVNFTANGLEENLNKSTMDRFLGYSAADMNRSETANETFSSQYSGSLAIGSRTITTGDECPMVTLNSVYQEVLLTDNTSVVFASIINDGATGFKNHPTDFEMIVGVNGTGTPRNYYFYVELS
jgi:hypothetical protein